MALNRKKIWANGLEKEKKALMSFNRVNGVEPEK